jgi:hypothetical protein
MLWVWESCIILWVTTQYTTSWEAATLPLELYIILRVTMHYTTNWQPATVSTQSTEKQWQYPVSQLESKQPYSVTKSHIQRYKSENELHYIMSQHTVRYEKQTVSDDSTDTMLWAREQAATQRYETHRQMLRCREHAATESQFCTYVQVVTELSVTSQPPTGAYCRVWERHKPVVQMSHVHFTAMRYKYFYNACLQAWNSSTVSLFINLSFSFSSMPREVTVRHCHLSFIEELYISVYLSWINNVPCNLSQSHLILWEI